MHDRAQKILLLKQILCKSLKSTRAIDPIIATQSRDSPRFARESRIWMSQANEAPKGGPREVSLGPRDSLLVRHHLDSS